MFKKIFCLFLFVIATTVLPAHEFWLSSKKYIYNYGDEINLRFMVGENFSGDFWTGDKDRVSSLNVFYKDVKDDLSGSLTKNDPDSIRFAVFDEGTIMATLQSTNAISVLDSYRFEGYLEKHKLKDALQYREENELTDSSGKELYQRSAKVLVQVGTDYTDTYKERTGMQVDIIPESNPYSIENEDSLPVLVLYNDEPLTNATVSVWKKFQNQVSETELKTDESGKIYFPVQKEGEWMVSTIKIVPLEGNEMANWQSYWGTLTWGYTK